MCSNSANALVTLTKSDQFQESKSDRVHSNCLSKSNGILMSCHLSHVHVYYYEVISRVRPAAILIRSQHFQAITLPPKSPYPSAAVADQ